MKLSRKLLMLLAVLLSFSRVAAACGDDDEGGGDSGDGLVIGTVLPETGGLAFLGPPQIEGAALAAADLEAAGANVTVITGDSGTDGAVAQETVGRLLGDRASFDLGPHRSDHRGPWADPDQSLVETGLGECRILGQEAIARV